MAKFTFFGRNTPVTILVTIIVIVSILFVATRIMSLKKRMHGKKVHTDSELSDDEKVKISNVSNNYMHPMAKPVQVVDSSAYADYFMPLP
jgi:FtsZ-interacting cell division protein ZipA